MVSFVVAVAVYLAIAAVPAIAQVGGPPPANSAAAKLPSWDVVSVKPHKVDDSVASWWQNTPAGLSANVSVRSLIMSAYELIMLDQVSGLPGWAETEKFDVEAKFDADNAEVYNKLPRDVRDKKRDLMMQALLADRFQLRIRHALKELPVYNLVIAKDGLKMKEVAPDQGGGYSMGRGRISSNGVEISSLVASLSNPVGRLIIDNTGLKGKYQFDLTWTWNDEPSSGDNGPSLFTALQDNSGSNSNRPRPRSKQS